VCLIVEQQRVKRKLASGFERVRTTLYFPAEEEFAVQIRNRFDVPIAPPDAWSFLMDIPSTVPCFPGAELIEQIDDENYKGRVTVKLGPLAMVFNGKLRVECDEAGRSGTVRANWTEAKGRGNATTRTQFALSEHESGTQVELDTDVQLAGQVAQYGRGVGMIADVSAQLISKFADNLRARINEAAMEHTEISGLTLASRALLSRFKRSGD
jgi:carbon monoxide dehydrogenase subunit G